MTALIYSILSPLLIHVHCGLVVSKRAGLPIERFGVQILARAEIWFVISASPGLPSQFRSRWVPAPYGLPQGSVLGPLLYVIYTSGIIQLLAEHSAFGQLYADDTQVYMHCVSSKAVSTVRAMGQTLTALEMWMASNRLCLNPAKTKFIWLGTRQQLAKLDLTDISSQFPNYAFASSVRDLGVILDQELSFALPLNRLTRDCFYQLRQFRTVARSLSIGAAATLVHSFVTNRLDYCLSLYAGLLSVATGLP